MHLGLIPALVNHFHTGCVFLLASFGGLGDAEKYVQLQRHLFRSGLETAIINVSTVIDNGQVHYCRRGRTLYVMNMTDEKSLYYLKRTKTSTPLRNSRWLLFPGQQREQATVQALEDIPIHFESELLIAKFQPNGSVSLTEVYRLSYLLPLRTLLWGSWEGRTGLKLVAPQSVYARRLDLFGTRIRVAAGHDPPYDYLLKNKNDSQLSMEGYSSEVWKQLEIRLNFTTVVYEARNNEWGSMHDDGTWSGMVGMILNNEVDAAVNSFQVTPARAAVVDFLTPLVTSKVCVFMQTPGILDSKWVVFFSPFALSVWITLIALIVLISIVLSCLGSFDQCCKKEHAFMYGLRHTVLCVYGIMCAQGHSKTPNAWSCRIVFWTAFFLALTMSASYSATFMAFLTFNKATLPFTSLEGLLKDGTYEFSVLAGSGLLTIFQNTTQEIMKSLYKTFIEPKIDSLPVEYLDSYQRICNKRKYTYMGDYNVYLLYASTLPCQISALPEESFQQYMAILVSKTLPYRRLFKHMLENMRETGFLIRIYRDKWATVADVPDITLRKVEFGDIMAPFCLLDVKLYQVSFACQSMFEDIFERNLKQQSSFERKDVSKEKE